MLSKQYSSRMERAMGQLLGVHMQLHQVCEQQPGFTLCIQIQQFDCRLVATRSSCTLLCSFFVYMQRTN
jgi:hypothetical protein